jgi:predicted DNA-binding transcriptional regulator AlpA
MLNVSQVMARLNIGKTAVYDLVKRGELHKPVKNGGSSRWIPEEIEADIEAMKAKRDEPTPVTRRGRPRKTTNN